MDIKLCALMDAAYLIGIIKTLRKLYAPSFSPPIEIEVALRDIDYNEQRALTQIAATSRARDMRMIAGEAGLG